MYIYLILEEDLMVENGFARKYRVISVLTWVSSIFIVAVIAAAWTWGFFLTSKYGSVIYLGVFGGFVVTLIYQKYRNSKVVHQLGVWSGLQSKHKKKLNYVLNQIWDVPPYLVEVAKANFMTAQAYNIFPNFVILLANELVKRCSASQLKAVIRHELGHRQFKALEFLVAVDLLMTSLKYGGLYASVAIAVFDRQGVPLTLLVLSFVSHILKPIVMAKLTHLHEIAADSYVLHKDGGMTLASFLMLNEIEDRVRWANIPKEELTGLGPKNFREWLYFPHRPFQSRINWILDNDDSIIVRVQDEQGNWVVT